MNVLITGGAGYMGYSVVKQLLDDVDAVHSITIYDNLSRKNYSFFTEARFDRKPLRFIQGDILDGRSLRKALEGIDCVIHLAAVVTTPFADHEPHIFDQVNNWGTAQLVAAIEQSSVNKFIHMSSIAVYGDTKGPLNEDTVPDPRCFYGTSKLDGEGHARLLEPKLGLFVIRSGNVYGYNPSYRTDAVINRFMFNANFSGRIRISGTGEQTRSFIHVDKIARVVVGAVDGKYRPGLYNAVEHNLSINQLAGHVQSIYPDLEIVHTNYNQQLRSIAVEVPVKLTEQFPFSRKSLNTELSEFKDRFSF
jgi:UDP-glucose 4-epimerase